MPIALPEYKPFRDMTPAELEAQARRENESMNSMAREFAAQDEVARMRLREAARENSGGLPDQPADNPSDPLAGAPPPWSGLTSGR